MEKKTGWQYKAIVRINRVIFSITGAIENACDELERQAYKRYGGYKITNDPDTPWCKDLTSHFRDENRVGEVKPGDVVYFDWSNVEDDQEHKLP